MHLIQLGLALLLLLVGLFMLNIPFLARTRKVGERIDQVMADRLDRMATTFILASIAVSLLGK